MSKTLFVNASDPNRINYDLDEKTSWKNTPRLVSLKKDDIKMPVCLYGIQGNEFPVELLPSLERMSDWASLCTSSFKMKDGFFPLLLDGQTLFFTDKENYSLMDQYWAKDNVYKIQLIKEELPQFEAYTLEKTEVKGWQQGIIVAQNIRVGGLFNKVIEVLPSITEFCAKHQRENVEITYSDRYIRDELSLIICMQFIKDLISSLKPVNYNVKMIGETFYNVEANNDDRRSLSGKAGLFISDKRRDEVGGELIQDNCFSFESKEKSDIPHYRELIVKAGDKTMRIMPDAGLAYWGLDVQQSKEDRVFYQITNGVNSKIPICSNSEQVYYVSIQ